MRCIIHVGKDVFLAEKKCEEQEPYKKVKPDAKMKSALSKLQKPVDLLGILTQPPTTPQKILPCPYMKLNHPLKPPHFGHDS